MTRWVLSLCLVLSGAAALTYEVIWLRHVTLVMGHTVYALSAVLTAFLGGLALGAYLGGRWTQRRGATPRLYAGIELAIGATALAIPWAIGAIDPLFGALYRGLGSDLLILSLAQFVVCGTLLLIPTVLMGMTLPVVVAVLRPTGEEITSDAGWLYALNSIGGVAGAALAGYVMLPALGMLATGWVAVGLNLAVAAVAATIPRAPAGEDTQRETRVTANDGGWPTPPMRLLVALYGLAGFAALALEVGWARLVSLSIGSTTHGFTLTLVTYITGLALGSWLLPRLGWIRRDPVRAIFALHGIVALWTLVSLPYLGSLPTRIAELIAAGSSPQALILAEGRQVFATIAVPTLAMGGIFPLVAQLIHRRVRAAGRAVGSAYAANTVGNILGAAVAGIVLVPAIGMRGTIVLSALLSAAVGLGYLIPALASSKRRGPLAAAAVLVVAVGVAAVRAPGWDRELVTSAPFLYGKQVWKPDATLRRNAIQQHLGSLIDYREGPTTVVSIRRLTDRFTQMYVGGVREASTGSRLFPFLGHLPMLLHGSAQNVLVVGLGGGTTLASVLRYPAEQVDCVELSPEVVYMARKHFAEPTGNPLDDPRARLIVGDGRNHLRHSGRRYDVIVSQPSYPWLSGAASLFTREYFTELREHLASNGIACVWFSTPDEESSRSIMRAWLEVFPRAYLFAGIGSRNVLIGLRDDRPLSPAALAQALRQPGIREELERGRVGRAEEMLTSFVDGPEEIAKLIEGAAINTDDNGYVEFRRR